MPVDDSGGNASELLSTWNRELGAGETGRLLLETLRLEIRAEGSWENGQPSPARQLPITQYLDER
jgi:hypothetical protein